MRVERGVFSSHLACVNPECSQYAQAGQGNLIIRKTYGRDHIRFLRCRACHSEFSERKNTPLWNAKIRESKANAIAEQLAEGTSVKATARLTSACPETIRRLASRLGRHATRFHDQHVQELSSTSLQADERWGFAGSKQHQLWQAEVIDPATRLVVSYATGRRNEALIEQIMQDAASRLSYPQGVVLFSDGEPSYARLFRRVFGRAYRPARRGSRGRFPKLRYRLTRRQAHVVVRKTRQGRRVVQVEARVAHGSSKRVSRELARLGFNKPKEVDPRIRAAPLGGSGTLPEWGPHEEEPQEPLTSVQSKGSHRSRQRRENHRRAES